MNISYYDFHDGYLIDIRHIEDNIEISMESAQIDPYDIKDNLCFSSHDTLKGKLHLERVKKIKINNILFFDEFKKPYDDGDIFDFDIKGNKVFLTILWKNYPPNFFEKDMWCSYEIEAEKIYWENIPNLHNPYWL